jgi:hypothetical protein
VVATLPYYRLFQFNTLGVIKRIAQHCSRPDEFPLLLSVLSRWRHRKIAELHYISIAVYSHNTLSLNLWVHN